MKNLGHFAFDHDKVTAVFHKVQNLFILAKVA